MNIIYKITNKINGKIYIGKTTQPFEKRKQQHKSQAKHNLEQKNTNRYFYNAINKHGFSNFDWDIIDTALTLEELNKKEIYHIAITSAYICSDLGYNMTSGGDGNGLFGKLNGMYGKKHTQKSKDKISKSNIGKYDGSDNPNFGNGDKIKGNKNPMWNKKGKEHPAHGRKHTPDELKKMSIKSRKPIIINGVHYDSRITAGEFLNINRDTITYRLNSKKFPNYTYEDKNK